VLSSGLGVDFNIFSNNTIKYDF